MTAAEAKAMARRTIEANVRAAVEASDRRLLEAVLAGDIDVDTAATTFAAIHLDMEQELPRALLEAERQIDALVAERQVN